MSYAPTVKDRQSSSSSKTSNKAHSYNKNNNKLASKSRSSINNTNDNNSQRQPDTSQHYQTPISSIQDISRSIRPDSLTNNNNNNNNSLFQPKLRISQPGDVYEQEADRVAEKVMAMSSMPTLSYSAVPPIGDNRSKARGREIDKKCTDCQMKGQQEKNIEISRKPSHASNLEASNQVSNENISNILSSSSGSPLDANTKEFMATRFRYDFSKVRIHTDAVAARSANSVNALAYTLGNNIVFAKGQYQPSTESGNKLLAHELTHVMLHDPITQNTIMRSVDEPEDASTATVYPSAFDIREEGEKGEHVVHKIDEYVIRSYHDLDNFYINISGMVDDEISDVGDDFRDWESVLINNEEMWEMIGYYYGAEYAWEPPSNEAIVDANYYYNVAKEDLQKIRQYKIGRIEQTISSFIDKTNESISRLGELLRFTDEQELLREAFKLGEESLLREVVNIVDWANKAIVRGKKYAISASGFLSEFISDSAVLKHIGAIRKWLKSSKYVEVFDQFKKYFDILEEVYSLLERKSPIEDIASIESAIEGFKAAGSASSFISSFFIAKSLSFQAFSMYHSEMISLAGRVLEHAKKVKDDWIEKVPRQLNKLAASQGKKTEHDEFEIGGKLLKPFMVKLMKSKNPSDIPDVEDVEDFLLKFEDLLNIAIGDIMPASGFWRFRTVEDYKIKEWLFNNKERLWKVFYGEMKTPRIRH